MGNSGLRGSAHDSTISRSASNLGSNSVYVTGIESNRLLSLFFLGFLRLFPELFAGSTDWDTFPKAGMIAGVGAWDCQFE